MPRLKLSEIIYYKLEKMFFGYQERGGADISLFDLTDEHIKTAEFYLSKKDSCTLHLYGRYNLKKVVKHFSKKGYNIELIDEDVLKVIKA